MLPDVFFTTPALKSLSISVNRCEVVVAMGLHTRLNTPYEHPVVLNYEFSCHRAFPLWNGAYLSFFLPNCNIWFPQDFGLGRMRCRLSSMVQAKALRPLNRDFLRT